MVGCVTARVAWADPWAVWQPASCEKAESGPVQSVPGRAPTRAVRLHDGARVKPCGTTLALKGPDARLRHGALGGTVDVPGLAGEAPLAGPDIRRAGCGVLPVYRRFRECASCI